ncbi:MAG: type III-B CRISPR module RAMP protein Cmr1 [Thermosphaera sp.]
MRHIATIKIESLTPSAIGGPDPNTHDDIFRVTSLRGLAAWWLRAIVSGAAYDKGDKNHDEKAIQAQKRVFGATSKSSLIIIKTKAENRREVNTQSIITIKGPKAKAKTTKKDQKTEVKHIRLQLLMMGRRDFSKKLESMLKNFDSTINVYSSAKTQKLEEVLGLHAIILSLLLEGLGKGSRRGLGAVKPSLVNLSPEVKKILQNEGCRGLLELSSKGVNENTLKMIIDDARTIAEKMLENGTLGKIQAEKQSHPPKIPSLSKSAAEIYIKRLEELRNAQSNEDRLAKLNTILKKLFLRSVENLESLPNKLQGIDVQKNVLDATALGSYILGLPRAAKPQKEHRYSVTFNTRTTSTVTARFVNFVPKDPKKQYSGFAKIVKIGDKGRYEHYRRPSPVIVSLLDEQTVVITFLKSSDWPEELQWFTTREKEVEARGINDAYKQVSEYLSKNYQKIWPCD